MQSISLGQIDGITRRRDGGDPDLVVEPTLWNLVLVRWKNSVYVVNPNLLFAKHVLQLSVNRRTVIEMFSHILVVGRKVQTEKNTSIIYSRGLNIEMDIA